MVNKKTVTFKVNGIHCNGCATKIKNNVGSLSIDQSVDVNIENGDVKIVFDSQKTSASELKTKILEVGFSIEGIELE